jgi:protein TonB
MISGPRTVSFTVAAALHVAAFAALLQLDAVRKPLLDAMPIMVSLIAPPPKVEAPPPPPKVVPPKPRPAAREPIAPPRAIEPPPLEPPLIAAEPSAPSIAVTPPLPPREPAPVVAPPPPPIVAPTFDAAYLNNPPPAYPPMSRRRSEEGTVVLRVFVNAEGRPEKVAVRASSGHELLDQAAHDTVHRWRFVPARQGDQPVAAWVLVPIKFALER